jgi:hypothetical protein
MQVVESHASDTNATVTLRYDFDGSDKGYPFLLRVDIAYTLDAHGFSFAVTATNRDPAGWPLPFYNGVLSLNTTHSRSPHTTTFPIHHHHHHHNYHNYRRPRHPNTKRRLGGQLPITDRLIDPCIILKIIYATFFQLPSAGSRSNKPPSWPIRSRVDILVSFTLHASALSLDLFVRGSLVTQLTLPRTCHIRARGHIRAARMTPLFNCGLCKRLLTYALPPAVRGNPQGGTRTFCARIRPRFSSPWTRAPTGCLWKRQAGLSTPRRGTPTWCPRGARNRTRGSTARKLSVATQRPRLTLTSRGSRQRRVLVAFTSPACAIR